MFDTKTTKDNEGVSPVIGVILMVAITVILAAVIGTFVLDLAGNLQKNAQMSVTFDEDTTAQTVDVQINSVQSGEYVELRDSGTKNTFVVNNSDSVGTADNSVTSPSTDITTVSSLTGSAVADFKASAGKTAVLHYGDVNNDGTVNGSTSGTITVVGFLDGQGSVLQTYDYGA